MRRVSHCLTRRQIVRLDVARIQADCSERLLVPQIENVIEHKLVAEERPR
jgi:hypothetical protein